MGQHCDNASILCASRHLRERAPTFAKMGSLECRTPGAALECIRVWVEVLVMGCRLPADIPEDGTLTLVCYRSWSTGVANCGGGASDDPWCSRCHPSHPRLASHDPDSLPVSGSSTEAWRYARSKTSWLAPPPSTQTIVSHKAVPDRKNNIQGG